MKRAEDIHSMRRRVSARDKALCVIRPFEESVKFLVERYNVDSDTASGFVAWLRGLYNPDGSMNAFNPVETWHTRFDEGRAEWVQVPPDQAVDGAKIDTSKRKRR